MWIIPVSLFATFVVMATFFIVSGCLMYELAVQKLVDEYKNKDWRYDG